MAVSLKTITDRLPKGTIEVCPTKQYFYRGFRMAQAYFLGNPSFNWEHHINQSFSDCMKPMTNRFMSVQ